MAKRTRKTTRKTAKKNTTRRAARTSRARKKPSRRTWVKMKDEQLLDVKLSDLDVKIRGSEIGQYVRRLYQELKDKGLEHFRPHMWLSSEWFTPDGVPGVAIPFYLAHPRLKKLERSQMLEVEGGTESWFMRILRHEAGHAIDNAYRLHYRPRWRQMFGKFSDPYPTHYQPHPYSRSFVIHIDPFYAQAHPAEDFAETFAVWLTPNSGWRQRYRTWPAMRKLEYVDELMAEIADKKPPVRNKRIVEPLHSLRRTLREHYQAKKQRYGEEWPDFFDHHLRRLFSDEPQYKKNMSAARFLQSVREEARRLVARWTGAYQYTIDQVFVDMIDRCRELNLRLKVPVEAARYEATMMVTVQTMIYLHEGHHKVAL